jgi:D-alanyl-D-alanine carboxypeptidase
LFSSIKRSCFAAFCCFATMGLGDVFKGAIVVDAADGSILFSEKADYVGPPASVTKLMTFLVVHDALQAGEISLTTPVTVTAEDSRMGGTQVWLKHNEVFTVEELLYALMIQSANDAAHALSHTAAPDRASFVKRMNIRAQRLGMTNTIWRSPHGLPPSSRKLSQTDMTSPRDLVKLSQALLRETDILRFSSIQSREFGRGYRPKPVMMRTHNHLVGKVRGVDGLKTGFTRAAGFCLSATAERDGKRIIAVIMGAPSSKERDIRMAELIEDAFAKLNPSPISSAPERPVISSAPVEAEPSAPKRKTPPVPALSIITIDPEPDAESISDASSEPTTVRFDYP